VLAERLLRRFRYQLIHRMLRFPRCALRRTSQGELVAVITAETEPLGGIMGDLIAQPVFQGGMMLTILGFLFIQNPWLGLAAAALIPVQALLIPAMQRRINLLNKARVAEVRRLAEEIGENAAGAGDLRVSGGWRRRLAQTSARLGRLCEIRFAIYKRKYFMKFTNNFITQMTPFLFFSIGGWLAIRGELTVGALVAAVAAHKDLSAPWRELLLWWNQTQEMTLRWRVIVERFDPPGLLSEALFDGCPLEEPRLGAAIRLERVTVREAGGAVLLDDLTATLPAGGMIAVASRSAEERRAFAELLARELSPSSGRVLVGERDLAMLHQTTIAKRIGYAGPNPYVFAGRIGDNLTIGLQGAPAARDLPDALRRRLTESARTGNSVDPAGGDWVDPGVAGLGDRAELLAWWVQLTEAMGTGAYLFQTGLDRRFDPAERPELARRLVALRATLRAKLEAAGVAQAVHRFDAGAFNPGLPVGGNLLFAAPTRDIPQEDMARDERFLRALDSLGIEHELLDLGGAVLEALRQTFGEGGTDHPMFRHLGIDAQLFATLLTTAAERHDKGVARLAPWRRRLLQTVPFRFSAEQIGEAFPDALKARIMGLRTAHRDDLRTIAGDDFEPLDEGAVARGLTVLENALFGKLSLAAGAAGERVRRIAAEVLEADGLKNLVAALIFDAPTLVGGANLSPEAHERIAFVRAALKRPDILILDRALASHDPGARLETRRRLRALLPTTTLIFLEEDFVHRDSFDLFLEIEDGRLVSDEAAASGDDRAAADLVVKRRKLEQADLFRGLDSRQLRLLAFGSVWVRADNGEALYREGDPADGAYLVVSGRAELRAPHGAALEQVAPGRLIGDLAVLLREPRRFDLVATEPVKALRIEAEALRSVIESDITVATSLLRAVANNLVKVGEDLMRREKAERSAGAPVPTAAPLHTNGVTPRTAIQDGVAKAISEAYLENRYDEAILQRRHRRA
jgi:putative ABC transport system ATP-binding protein